MNTNDYLKIKALRDTFDDALHGPAEVLNIEKTDLVTLFNAALGRSFGEVEFTAKLIKITPKERRDDDILEVTLSATFDNELLGGVGRYFGRQMTVIMEPAPQQIEDGDDDDEHQERHEDPNQMNLPLDADEEGTESAEIDPLTGYNGDDESESVELPTF